jgi:molybdopterin molybdotransferase
MRSVEEALTHILDHVSILTTEYVMLDDALGRVLAEDTRAQHDLPPFANSAMDGYAVIAADLQSSTADNPTILAVIEDIPAGYAPQKTLQSGQASRIMTGAPLPNGADAIVPVELTDDTRRGPTAPDQIKIFASVSTHDHVRAIGEDIQTGEILLKQGRRLRPADLGVLAGLGFPEVLVTRRPRVAVISTGDELLTPDQPLTPGKIRDTNGYVIPALITSLGAIPIKLGIARDTVESVREKFNAAVEQGADLILSSAGVSVGAFDVVKTVLDELGAVDFWKVNMRPGKPLTFGHIRDVLFLGLPGNPVSSMVTFDVFARPMILKMLGSSTQVTTQKVRVGEAMTSDGRTTFARAYLKHENDELVAYSTGTQSSGALSSMVKADGLLVIPADITQVQPGDYLQFRPNAHL